MIKNTPKTPLKSSAGPWVCSTEPDEKTGQWVVSQPALAHIGCIASVWGQSNARLITAAPASTIEDWETDELATNAKVQIVKAFTERNKLRIVLQMFCDVAPAMSEDDPVSLPMREIHREAKRLLADTEGL